MYMYIHMAVTGRMLNTVNCSNLIKVSTIMDSVSLCLYKSITDPLELSISGLQSDCLQVFIIIILLVIVYRKG